MQLGNSDVLTASLEEEYNRWLENVNVINKQIVNLVGDVFLAAASMSY